jgi:serine/threonine-protein kinase
VKLLHPHLVRDASVALRFEREAKAAAMIRHPNVVRILDLVTAEDGARCIVMDLLEGESLGDRIVRVGPLSPEATAALLLPVMHGLADAHRQRIVHRDLKPDNILLTHHGIPKIGDFGLAKKVIGGAETGDEKLVGTPHFMAPELFRGARATPSSDVYALGVCYFLLLTGRVPYICNSLKELKQAALSEPMPSLRDVCPEITLEMAECLHLLTAKTPQNRPRDAIEASQLLNAVSGQLQDIESLLTDAFRDTEGVTWKRDASRYQIEIVMPNGRRQTLFVEPSDHAFSDRLLLIFSVCCRARPDFYEEALRLNAEVPHGGLALRQIDGENMFVMVDTYPRATVDSEEVRRSVLEVAYRADAIEKLLTGRDVH